MGCACGEDGDTPQESPHDALGRPQLATLPGTCRGPGQGASLLSGLVNVGQ